MGRTADAVGIQHVGLGVAEGAAPGSPTQPPSVLLCRMCPTPSRVISHDTARFRDVAQCFRCRASSCRDLGGSERASETREEACQTLHMRARGAHAKTEGTGDGEGLGDGRFLLRETLLGAQIRDP